MIGHLAHRSIDPVDNNAPVLPRTPVLPRMAATALTAEERKTLFQ